ncbi:MAG: Crp/Fnr family transcriptional regulator [Bacteroidetes bacterium]|nr:Crp/Fnr family transcriptional regulator [Bacteroidota bacterium]
MPDQLVAKFRELGPVSAEMEAKIREEAFTEEYKAGKIILHQGEVCRKICLVTKGLTRSYYINDGKEVTSRFMGEGFIVTSWISYYTQKPTAEIIETLEDTTLICLHEPVIQKMYQDFPASNIIGREQVEYAFFLSEKRTQLLRGLTAGERFSTFADENPTLLTRVSMKHIASYLGMTEETLSRVRSKMYRPKNGIANS